MFVKNFLQAQKYLYDLIPAKKHAFYAGKKHLKRQKHLMQLIGDPQEKLKVIHIAGTSGKGSTAQFISSGLEGLGFKVGLHISPHVIDIRERVQVNNHLISKKKFVKYLNAIIPLIEKMRFSKIGAPTYFEALIALAYYSFKKERVDFAVIETGLGGLYDGTNIVRNKSKLAVITKIGKDHTEVLGNTIKKIAFHKAGIIQKGNTVVSTMQSSAAKKIISRMAKRKKAKLFFAEKSFPKNEFPLRMNGEYQIENASLAFKVISILFSKNYCIQHSKKIFLAMKKTYLPGRFDVLKKKKCTIVLDGAHNPQKMAAFVSSLEKKFPSRKFLFVVAFKKKKNYKKMLDLIIPLSSKIIVSSFSVGQDIVNISEDPLRISRHVGKKVPYKIHSNPKKAVLSALKLGKNKNTIIVFTGSFYFLSEVYNVLNKCI